MPLQFRHKDTAQASAERALPPSMPAPDAFTSAFRFVTISQYRCQLLAGYASHQSQIFNTQATTTASPSLHAQLLVISHF